MKNYLKLNEHEKRKLNENGNTNCIIRDVTKAVLKRAFIPLNMFIRRKIKIEKKYAQHPTQKL